MPQAIATLCMVEVVTWRYIDWYCAGLVLTSGPSTMQLLACLSLMRADDVPLFCCHERRLSNWITWWWCLFVDKVSAAIETPAIIVVMLACCVTDDNRLQSDCHRSMQWITGPASHQHIRKHILYLKQRSVAGDCAANIMLCVWWLRRCRIWWVRLDLVPDGARTVALLLKKTVNGPIGRRCWSRWRVSEAWNVYCVYFVVLRSSPPILQVIESRLGLYIQLWI